MAEDQAANAANQVINTLQPKPLVGLKLRGVKKIKTIRCQKDEDTVILVNEADYDKSLHGPKLASEKLPTRKEKSAKKDTKKVKDADDGEGEE